eukprot:gene7133-11446_t
MFSNIDKFIERENDFDDYLRNYGPTVSIISAEVNSGLLFYDICAGNQKNKWKQFYPIADKIIYMVSLASFLKIDEYTYENAMIETINSLKKILNESIILDFPIYIVLTKKDVFMEFFNFEKFKEIFKEYEGNDDAKDALEFLNNYFKNFDKKIRKVFEVNLLDTKDSAVFIENLDKMKK